MQVLTTVNPIIIDIAKQDVSHKRRIAISIIKQVTTNGVLGQLEVRALCNDADKQVLLDNGYITDLNQEVFLNQGNLIPTLAPLQKELTNEEIDQLDSTLTYPTELTTKSQKDNYFDLMIAKHFIITENLFGGLTDTDLEVKDIDF